MSKSTPSGTPAEAARWRRQSLVTAIWALPNAIMVSLINIALPEIQAEFRVGPGALTWAASGYIVSGAIGAVIYGRLADVFGLRRIAVFCLFAFALMSLCVALAPSYPWVVAFRIPQGLVGMALSTLGMSGMLLLLPAELRGRAVGQMMGVFGLGVVLGSIGAGMVIQFTDWRTPFLLAAALALALIPLSLSVIPPFEPSAHPPRLDKTGACLITVAAGSTLVAANQLPRPDGLGIGLAALILALVFWTVFVRQVRRSPSPFVDPEVLRSLPFLRSCALGGLFQGQFVLAGFVFPLALKNLFGYSVADVGILMSAGFLTVLVVGITGSRILATLGSRRTLILAVVLSIAGAAGCSVFGMRQVAAVAVLYAMLGAAYTLVQPVLINATGRLLPPGYSGAGMGFYNFSYFAAGAFCVALAGGIIERRVMERLTWTTLHGGAATGYVDALLVLAVLSAISVVVLVRLLHDPGFERLPGRRGPA